MILPAGNYGPTATQFRRTDGAGYAEWYNQAKSQAIAIDNTAADLDSRDGFVEFSHTSTGGIPGKTLVQHWDGERQAKVTFVSSSYAEDAAGGVTTATQKDRYLEMQADPSRGLLLISDRLTQNVDQYRGDDSKSLVNDHRERTAVLSSVDGYVYAEGANATLLYESGWTVAEFQRRRSDLGL